MQYLIHLFTSQELTPHGFCLLWQPALIWLHIVSDGLIGVSYYSIPLALGYFVWKRPDVAFSWIFVSFAVFILACGTTHFFEIWTLWHADYVVQGLLKALTALVSVATAISLWPLLPRALALPSPSQLRSVNENLSAEIAQRTEAVNALEREMNERQKTEATLRQMQKMEGLGQLTGGVAHDFNNLLLILQSNLHILKQKCASEANEPHISAMERALTRGESLTKQLLTFARRQTLQPKPIVIHEEMVTLKDLLSRSLRSDIEIELNLAPAVWDIEVDPNEFELAMINLASNARDAMPKGGRLTIQVDNQTLDGSDVALEITGEFVRIAVSDTGKGIGTDVLSLVFEPFFTTKETDKGTGLGLSQVYGFARQSGGFATAGNVPASGAVITLYLPRSKSHPLSQSTEKPAPVSEPGHEKILVVEDNHEVAEISVTLLEQLGYEVVLAHNPAQALSILKEGQRVDLVFSDIIMPGGMNGIDLARTLKTHFPNLPVLLTTGYSAGAPEAATEGFPILAKPYKLDTLNVALHNLLRQKK